MEDNMINNIRLVCSEDLMPLNEGEPIFEGLLTLPVKKYSLEELLSQIDGLSEPCIKKYNMSQGDLRDC